MTLNGGVGVFLGSGGAVGRRVKLDYDVALCFDWFAIHQCWLVAPFVDGSDDRWNQACRAVNRPDVLDVSILGHGGIDANGADLNLSILGIDAGNQFADHHFLVSIEGPPSMCRGHANRTLDVDGKGGCL